MICFQKVSTPVSYTADNGVTLTELTGQHHCTRAFPSLHLPGLQSRVEDQWLKHNGKSLYAHFTQVPTGVSNMHIIIVLLARKKEMNPAEVKVHNSGLEGLHQSQGPKPASSTPRALQRQGEGRESPVPRQSEWSVTLKLNLSLRHLISSK